MQVSPNRVHPQNYTTDQLFLHMLAKHHASDSLLIVSMIMLTHCHRILHPHKFPPHAHQTSHLQLTAYHAIIGFFTHTRNFHTCLKGMRGTSFSCLQKRYYFCSVSQLSLCSELSTQSLLQLLHTEPILILSSAMSSLAFHLTYFYTGWRNSKLTMVENWGSIVLTKGLFWLRG